MEEEVSKSGHIYHQKMGQWQSVMEAKLGFDTPLLDDVSLLLLSMRSLFHVSK
jgi:hypothetical protein